MIREYKGWTITCQKEEAWDGSFTSNYLTVVRLLPKKPIEFFLSQWWRGKVADGVAHAKAMIDAEPKPRKKIIHVNMFTIRFNRTCKKKRDLKPPIIVRVGGKSFTGFRLEILESSKMVYHPHDPLRCGARLWVETTSPVVLDGKEIK